ncbi:hypothetical protein ABK046_49765, partial [Streptomyces caeruleatus]
MFTDQVTATNFYATSTTATSTFAGGLNVAGTSGLTVLQNGRVGLGTAKPWTNLVVDGNVQFGDSSDSSAQAAKLVVQG